MPEADDRRPALYVLRDGRDCYVSYAHYAIARFPGDYPGMDYAAVLRMLIESPHHFSGWSRHVEAWMARPAPTAIVRYEDLLVNPAVVVADACRELGLAPPEPAGSLPDFGELHDRDPHRYRKGITGSWKTEMPPDLEDLFWSIHGDAMERFDYGREPQSGA